EKDAGLDQLLVELAHGAQKRGARHYSGLAVFAGFHYDHDSHRDFSFRFSSLWIWQRCLRRAPIIRPVSTTNHLPPNRQPLEFSCGRHPMRRSEWVSSLLRPSKSDDDRRTLMYSRASILTACRRPQPDRVEIE